MKILSQWTVVILLLGCRILAAEDFAASTTGAPTGKHQVISLELSEGLRETPQALRLTFRGEGCVNFWFLNQGYERINLLSSTLKLTEKAITGELRLRL